MLRMSVAWAIIDVYWRNVLLPWFAVITGGAPAPALLTVNEGGSPMIASSAISLTVIMTACD
jgi:hypothetical protein